MNTTDICAILEVGRTQNTTGATGIGVLLFFLITAFVIFFLAAASNSAKICQDQSVLFAIRPVLSTICDSQMILGICLQAYGLVNGYRLQWYQFVLLWMVSILTTTASNVHLATLIAFFKPDGPLERWPRILLMTASLSLCCCYTIIAVRRYAGLGGDNPSPISCAWLLGDQEGGPPPVVGVPFLVAAHFALDTIVFLTNLCQITSGRTERGQEGFLSLLLAVSSATACVPAIFVVSKAPAFGWVLSNSQHGGADRNWGHFQVFLIPALVIPALISLVRLARQSDPEHPAAAGEDDLEDNDDNKTEIGSVNGADAIDLQSMSGSTLRNV